MSEQLRDVAAVPTEQKSLTTRTQTFEVKGHQFHNVGANALKCQVTEVAFSCSMLHTQSKDNLSAHSSASGWRRGLGGLKQHILKSTLKLRMCVMWLLVLCQLQSLAVSPVLQHKLLERIKASVTFSRSAVERNDLILVSDGSASSGGVSQLWVYTSKDKKSKWEFWI